MKVREAVLLGASWLAFTGAATAQELTPEQREQRLLELESRLADLEGQINDLRESAAADAADIRRIQTEAPAVTLANGRPTIATSDGAFRVAFRGLIQHDAANYLQDDDRTNAIEPAAARDLNSGTNFRRARIGIEGTAFRDWNYAITYEAGSGSGTESAGLQQAWVEYAGWKPFGLTAPVRIRAGAFAVENTLEGATSNSDQLFLERPSSVEVVRSAFGGDGRNALGIFANGDRLNLSAVLTGSLINTGGYSDEQTGAVARVAWLPVSSPDYSLHLGANYSTIFQLADTSVGAPGVPTITYEDRPELRVDGTRLVSAGPLPAHNATSYGVELGGQWKNLFASAEYIQFQADRTGALDTAEFSGWYVQGSWILTGEQRRWNAANGGFGGIRPTNAFDPRADKWGAFEIAGRYSLLDLNDREGVVGSAAPSANSVRGGEQVVTSLGLNWYPNSVVRFMLDFQNVDVDRIGTGNAQVGQNYKAIALRTQVSF